MPLFDVALLSVFTISLYLGAQVIRRYGAPAMTFGIMLLGCAALSAISLASRLLVPDSSEIGEVLGVIAIGAGVCLILVPPMLRDFARRALIRDHLRIARWLVDLRELLQPGMGSAHERELIDTIIAVRGGRIEEAITRLENARSELGAPARRRLDERIIMTYLYARQWPEAIEHYERLSAGGVPSASLQLLVEMVRAYCEAGKLEAASELVAHLEASEIREEPALAFLLNRSRLVFLAFVGRTGAVERLAGPRGPLAGMPREAGAFWSGLARHYAGDRAGAVASLSDAVKYSARDKRATELASSALERAKNEGGEPRSVPADVATLADSLTEVVLAAPLAPKNSKKGPPRLVGVALGRIPVTAALVAANLAVAAAVYLFFGTAADIGALVRAGANVKSVTLGGEYWRWISYQFIHAGWLHLAINGYGLWVLGKITEQLYGSRRMLIVYLSAGLIGGIASTLSGPATSVGASGAIFGLLGAALVELGIHRKHYPQSWTRSLTGLLLLLTAVNIVVGFVYPIIDQAAHLGGLAAGGVLGLALSKHTPWGGSKVLSTASTIASLVFCGAILWAGYGVASDSIGDTIAIEPRVEHEFPGEVFASLPSSWSERDGGTVFDQNRLGLIDLRLERTAGQDSSSLEDLALIELHAEQHERAKQRGFVTATRTDSVIDVPAGFTSHELVVRTEDVGGVQTYRAIVFARRLGPQSGSDPTSDRASTASGTVFGTIYIPENLARQLTPLVRDILTSIRATSNE